jgi:hypothetical protein
MEIDEEIKRQIGILTLQRDDFGNKIDSEAYWVPTLMRSYGNDARMFMEDESKLIVSFKDLVKNPLNSLLVLETSFYMVGIGNRLTADERQIFEKYPFKGPEKGFSKLITRQLDLRQQHKPSH